MKHTYSSCLLILLINCCFLFAQSNSSDNGYASVFEESNTYSIDYTGQKTLLGEEYSGISLASSSAQKQDPRETFGAPDPPPPPDVPLNGAVPILFVIGIFLAVKKLRRFLLQFS